MFFVCEVTVAVVLIDTVIKSKLVLLATPTTLPVVGVARGWPARLHVINADKDDPMFALLAFQSHSRVLRPLPALKGRGS